MKTYKRVCLKDYDLTQDLKLERGKEYLTSEVEDGMVTVFTRYWIDVPVGVFTGEIKFTE